MVFFSDFYFYKIKSIYVLVYLYEIICGSSLKIQSTFGLTFGGQGEWLMALFIL